MRDTIISRAASLKDDLVTFLREIIAIPSMNGDEKAVVSRIEQEMKKIGYDDVWADGLGNLFGRIGSGKRLLVIDGHCDTVDVGNQKNWDVDPFKGDFRDGYIYGRGAADQKGGLAAAVYSGIIIKEIGLPEDVSLIVGATVLEEDFEGISWKYALNEGNLRPEAFLLTEPTELGIRTGQRGRMEMKVTAKGISCHGSAPERGENAIYKMAPVIAEIEQLNSRLNAHHLLGKGTITITEICSTAPSLCAVADSTTIHLDRRLTSGDTFDSALEEVKNLPSVKNQSADVTVPEYTVKAYTGIEYPQKAYYPAWLLDIDHPLVVTAVKGYRDVFEDEPEIRPWVFSTNGVSTMGLYNIPTIGFGPGEERQAHAPNECVLADDLVKALSFYTAFVLRWSGEREITGRET
ncbi:YgeY family selenium metabolism-linked hydrolase [candidate division KSB1 bacterium]